MNVIVAQNIVKQFGDFYALRGVSLTIPQGSFFGLCGPNGAGKTTFLRILTGQLEPTAGHAIIFNFDVSQDPLRVKREIAIMPETESPPSFLTVEEYLYFVARVREMTDFEGKIDGWIDFFRIEEKRETLCKDLSKGMRQKVMLAATFLPDTPLIFLDEPFINLDPIFQRKVRAYLALFIQRGGTIFMNTHILEIAEKLCDRIAIINRGEIIAAGTMAQLRAHPQENLEQVFMRLVGEADAYYTEGFDYEG